MIESDHIGGGDSIAILHQVAMNAQIITNEKFVVHGNPLRPTCTVLHGVVFEVLADPLS